MTNSKHMQIQLINTGKRFNREWIFRGISQTFLQGKSYAITGSNGSGKSTLLQVIAGALMCSEGKIDYANRNGEVIADTVAFQNISIAAPYLELIEEMTANEFLTFHQTFKPIIKPISTVLEIVGLGDAANKQIRYYSSGMKQRLKLAQAFFSATSVLLLDEPTTNLDQKGIELYKMLISDYTQNKLVIVCSNDTHEYDFCETMIRMEIYK